VLFAGKWSDAIGSGDRSQPQYDQAASEDRGRDRATQDRPRVYRASQVRKVKAKGRFQANWAGKASDCLWRRSTTFVSQHQLLDR